MSGAVWKFFTPGEAAAVADVNGNFAWIQNHLLPMKAGSTFDDTYDLGAGLYPWRRVYAKTAMILAGTTISGPTDGTTLEVAGGNLTIKTEGVRGQTANTGGAAREIAAGTVSTPDFRTGAINVDSTAGATLLDRTGAFTALKTVLVSGGGTGAFPSATIASVTLMVEKSMGSVMIFAHATLQITADSAAGSVEDDVYLVVSENGVAIQGIRNRFVRQNVGDIEVMGGMICAIQQFSAGSHRLDFMYRVQRGVFNAVNNYGFGAIEIRA